LLVRSTATQWAKGSILAVDAGTHLASIIKILTQHQPYAKRTEPTEQTNPRLEQPLKPKTLRKSSGIGNSKGETSSTEPPPFVKHASNYFTPVSEAKGTRAGSPGPARDPAKPRIHLTTGPFADLVLPYDTPKANAAYLLRNLISTYLITHPHLDHLSGFAVNTASFQHTSRPKKLAALPSTINAIKTHIFNDVIWPNLTDEEGGVGLVSYMRLVEGGNVALGDGDGRGYIELCDGLSVKAWSVSHGHCMRRHFHHSNSPRDEPIYPSARRASRPNTSPLRRGSLGLIDTSVTQDNVCVIDSSAFFIRDEQSGREILVFGDVEPDSISLSPRTARVWADAAPKIASGSLGAIFIECSYDDSQTDETLFGHLAPRHLIDELRALAHEVKKLQNGIMSPKENRKDVEEIPETTKPTQDTDLLRKRKRFSNGLPLQEEARRGRAPYPRWRTADTVTSSRGPNLSPDSRSRSSPDSKTVHSESTPHTEGFEEEEILIPIPAEEWEAEKTVEFGAEKPLEGLKVVIIHVKDALRDGPPVEETILRQLCEREREVGLGVHFVLAKTGGDVWV
jgi:cAMP phosphodiesterase